MKLKLNGEVREVADGITVQALLNELGIVQQRVAVEVNAEIVRRSRHPEFKLSDGDAVEIVAFVGGG